MGTAGIVKTWNIICICVAVIGWYAGLVDGCAQLTEGFGMAHRFYPQDEVVVAGHCLWYVSTTVVPYRKPKRITEILCRDKAAPCDKANVPNFYCGQVTRNMTVAYMVNNKPWKVDCVKSITVGLGCECMYVPSSMTNRFVPNG